MTNEHHIADASKTIDHIAEDGKKVHCSLWRENIKQRTVNDMRLWLRKLIEKIKYHLSHEWCYDRMEAEGIAAMGCCCGLVGGTRATDYLQEHCCDCPHLAIGAMPYGERKDGDT